MKPVFVDAYFYVACVNRLEQYHQKAMLFANRRFGRMVTTRLVLVEVADALAGSACRPKVPEFISLLEQDPQVTIVEPRPSLLQRGLQLYNERADKKWTLTDCVSFIVMGDEGLTDALTGDHHFEQAGFKALLR